MSQNSVSLSGLATAAAGWVRDAVNGRVSPATSADDLILGAASTEWAAGTELKMFFDKSKAALRGGSFTNNLNDDATRGNYSFCWGSNSHRAPGADAVALGNNAIASGAQSFAAAGSGAAATGDYGVAFQGGTASGNSSFTMNGNGNVASGTYSIAAGAGSSTASANGSVAIGQQNTASAYFAFATGQGGVASRFGQWTRGTVWNGGTGDAQKNQFLAKKTTTSATPTPLLFEDGQYTSNAVTLTGIYTNVLTIPVSKAHKVTLNVIARRTDTPGTFAGWSILATVVRSSSGDARFVGTPLVVTADKDAGASTWDLALSIDTSNATNNYLAITATGESGATIKWVADLTTVEVA